MALLSGEAEWQRAVLRPAFSNGSEGEAWMAKWCHHCANDMEDDCPLVMVAMLGRTPAAWAEEHPCGLADRYTCPEFVTR